MNQDPLDHGRVFDARDDLDTAAAVRAGLDVDLKHSLEPLRPAHCCTLLGRCAIFQGFRLLRLVGSPPAGQGDPSTMGAIGCKHPMEASEIQARRWNERCQSSDEIQRLEDHMGCSVPVALVLKQYLRAQVESGKFSVLMATHALDVVEQYADTALICHDEHIALSLDKQELQAADGRLDQLISDRLSD